MLPSILILVLDWRNLGDEWERSVGEDYREEGEETRTFRPRLFLLLLISHHHTLLLQVPGYDLASRLAYSVSLTPYLREKDLVLDE